MRNTTRYLSAAAYLDPGFRDQALAALLDRRHHAVAPSAGGFDLIPVLRHCLNSRALLTVRDVAVSVLLLFAVIFNSKGLLPWIMMLAVLGLLASGAITGTGPQRRGGLRPLAVGGALFALLTVLVVPVYAISLMTGDQSEFGVEESGADVSWLGTLLFLGAIGTVIAYRVRIYRILSEMLQPGATYTGAESVPRLAEIKSAQHGNLTLYSGENPFIGAGNLVRAWTIAAELDRRKNAAGDRRLAEVDAVELHDFVGGRLAEMRLAAEPGMPVHLEILDHVVAPGRLNQIHGDHPLIDERHPRHELDREAVHAIIRNPQAGARHYRWIAVGTSGEAVTDRRGGQVLPAEDRDTTVSIFIHLAIEGRMIYTEFIVTALPPVKAAHRVVDELPRDGGSAIVWAALTRAPLHLARDLVAAPLRLLRRAAQALRNSGDGDDPDKYVVYDFGVRVSLRELGAEPQINTFLEGLDAFKYAKLVEERLNNAVLDYLDQHGVDTAAYRQQIAAVINNGTVVTGGTFTGSNIGGQSAQFAAKAGAS